MDWSLLPDLWQATQDTLYMVGVSTLWTVLLGLPLGVLLVITDRDGLLNMPVLHQILGAIVNIGRSLPFIILMVALIPLTRLIIGTTIGTTAAIVPLIIAAVPFFGRVAETSLREVDSGVIEAARAMGCSSWQVVRKGWLPEGLPSLVLGMTITIISLSSYLCIACARRGGGLAGRAARSR